MRTDKWYLVSDLETLEDIVDALDAAGVTLCSASVALARLNLAGSDDDPDSISRKLLSAWAENYDVLKRLKAEQFKEKAA